VNYVGIDPGQTTGVAVLRSSVLADVDAFRMPDELEEFVLYLGAVPDPVTYVVEDWVGSGALDRHAKLTIEIIGAVKAEAARRDVDCIAQQPQARIHKEDEARRLIRESGLVHFMSHHVSALAHALRAAKKGG